MLIILTFCLHSKSGACVLCVTFPLALKTKTFLLKQHILAYTVISCELANVAWSVKSCGAGKIRSYFKKPELLDYYLSSHKRDKSISDQVMILVAAPGSVWCKIFTCILRTSSISDPPPEHAHAYEHRRHFLRMSRADEMSNGAFFFFCCHNRKTNIDPLQSPALPPLPAATEQNQSSETRYDAGRTQLIHVRMSKVSATVRGIRLT